MHLGDSINPSAITLLAFCYTVGVAKWCLVGGGTQRTMPTGLARRPRPPKTVNELIALQDRATRAALTTPRNKNKK